MKRMMTRAMTRTMQWSVLILGLLLAAACSPVTQLPAAPAAAQPSPTAETAADGAADTAGAAAAGLPADIAAALAAELGVPAAEMTVVSAEPVEWNDACLGVTGPDEMCAQVITPGYRVVVEAGGEQHTYHTDSSGSSLRLAPAQQAAADKPIPALDFDLTYNGPLELGSSDTSRCAQMTIASGEVRLVECGGEETALPLPEGLASTLDDLRGRLGSFTYETDSEQVTFQGSGESAGPEWQRAVLAWARITRAELASGQTSAAARTALSWNLGLVTDTPGVCAHLTVLDYGYAYAEQRNCENGDLVSSVEGWLEQAEMEQFDGWLYNYAPLYAGDNNENYVNGVGEASMSEDEAAAVADWAQALWERLVGLPLASADASADASAAGNTAAASCDGAAGEVFRSDEYGFCLLVPQGYSVVETAPGSFSLVAGGDIMNHTDPRVSIEVTDAGDRTLADVTGQMVQDYVPAGEAVEPQAVTVGGVDGVLLDNLPGQDFNRRLAAIADGRVYSLMLTPLNPEAEPFYQGVIDSLQFVAAQ